MHLKLAILPIGLLLCVGIFWGCEFSGNSDGFNTSGGAGVEVNISGFYEGNLSGAKAVNASAGNINNFTLTQAGNRVEIVDNQGSRYVGTVGSPDINVSQQAASIPASTQIMQFQVNWQGRDGVSAKDIQFVGVIDVVALSDVQGQTTSDTRTTTRATNNSADHVSNQTTTTTGPTIVGTGNNNTTNNNNTTTTTTDTTSFFFTPGNSRFRLQGTWVESGGRSSNVSALSAGSGRLVNSSLTVTAPDGVTSDTTSEGTEGSTTTTTP